MSSTDSRSRVPRRFWKKFLFTLVAGGASLLLLEGVAHLALPIVLSQGSPGIQELHEQQEIVAKSGRGVGNAQEILHPYLGWMLDPDTNPGTTINGEHFPVNRLGFIDSHDSIQKRGPGKVIIGIFGGSFAHEFALMAYRRFQEQLASDPAFAGKEIVLVRLGVSGFKQPQPLLVLAYLYSLGAEFDYVVSLDGFNEVTLTETGNLPAGISYTYPFQWHIRLQDVVVPRDASISYQVLRARAKRQEVAEQAMASPVRWSALYCLIWKCRDMAIQRELVNYGMEVMNRRQSGGRGFAIAGPTNPQKSIEDLRLSFVDLWKRCTWEMKILASAHGAEYLQCLQPNQYVAGSKVFSEAEVEFAYAPNHQYERAVRGSYPLLQQAGLELQSRGMSFVDLTGIFRDEKGTIYRDWCCHLNQTGYDLVADAIAAALTESAGENRTKTGAVPPALPSIR